MDWDILNSVGGRPREIYRRHRHGVGREATASDLLQFGRRLRDRV